MRWHLAAIVHFALTATAMAHATPVYLESGRLVSQGFARGVGNTCYILTAAHGVSRGNEDIFAYTPNGVRYPLKIEYTFAEHDLAALVHDNDAEMNGSAHDFRNLCVKGVQSYDRASIRDLEAILTRGQAPGGTRLNMTKVTSIAGGTEVVNFDLVQTVSEEGRLKVRATSDTSIVQSDSGSMIRLGYNQVSNEPVGMILNVDKSGVATALFVDVIDRLIADQVSPLPDIDFISDHFRVVSIEPGSSDTAGLLSARSGYTDSITFTLETNRQHRAVSAFRLRCRTTFTGCVFRVFASGSSYDIQNVDAQPNSWKSMSTSLRGKWYTFYETRSVRSLRIVIVGDLSKLKSIELQSD